MSVGPSLYLPPLHAPLTNGVAILEAPMFRGSRPRESKAPPREVRMSTLEEKFRRHRNKERIWQRAVKRLTTRTNDAYAAL